MTQTIADETENDKADVLIDCAQKICDLTCRLAAKAKEASTNVSRVVYVDSDGNDAVQLVYGFRYHTWKSTDTLDKLAASYLGSADYSSLLAYYNEIAVESEVEAGTKIKIPNLTESAADSGNRVYAEPAKRDNYGADIALDDDGDFQSEGGDFKAVSGADNLAQALAMRLTTASENRLRLTSYGIRVATGDAMAIQSYLLGSIEQTVKTDPRIDEVSGIDFEGTADGLNLRVTYSDINGASGEYEGAI